MNNKRIIIALLLTLLSILSIAQTERDQTQSITIEELKDHIYYLASDFLQGRQTGTNEYQIAANYVASQLKAAGVAPVCLSDDGSPTYFQNMILRKKQMSNQSRMVFSKGQKQITFNYQEDFKLFQAEKEEFPQIVFAGYGIEEPEYGWNDYENLSIENKLVFLLEGAPEPHLQNSLPAEIIELYNSTKGRYKKFDALLKRKPAGIFLVYGPGKDEAWNNQRTRTSTIFYLPGIDDPEKFPKSFMPDLMYCRWEVFAAVVDVAENIPFTSNDVFENYQSCEFDDVSMQFNYEYQEEDVQTQNVIGVVTGTDPNLQSEYVTLGAHLDHIGTTSKGVSYNGADDNASGCAAILEVIEEIQKNPLKRSVLVVFYSGEELDPVGLYGSRYFLNNCPVPVSSITANLNLDMLGRSTDENEKDKAHYIIGYKEDSDSLLDTILVVNERTIDWPLIKKYPEDFRGDGDHSSFHEFKIPSVFFFSGEHEDLHRTTDDAEKIDWNKLQSLSHMIYFVVEEIADN